MSPEIFAGVGQPVEQSSERTIYAINCQPADGEPHDLAGRRHAVLPSFSWHRSRIHTVSRRALPDARARVQRCVGDRLLSGRTF